MRLALVPVLLVVLAGASCDDAMSPSPDIVRGNGTVVYMSFEGGFWAIAADPPSPTVSDGTTYDPLGSLPQAFRQQGLRVRFEGKIRNDLASVHMNGPIIEILNIRRL